MQDPSQREGNGRKLLQLRRQISTVTNAHVRSKLARACDSVAATESQQAMWSMLRCVAGTSSARRIITQLHTTDGQGVVTGKRELADRLAGHLEALGQIPESMLQNEVVQKVRTTVQALRVCKDWTKMREGSDGMLGVDSLNRHIGK